jgi:hypothetical protein
MIIGGTPRTRFDVELESGQVVHMDRILLDYTYGGVMEGDPSFMPPARWIDAAVDDAIFHFHLRDRAKRNDGVFVIEPRMRETPPFPAGPHVPYVRALAFASSWHKGNGSACALVWFQDSFDEPLLARFTEAMRKTPWHQVAIEWDPY